MVIQTSKTLTADTFKKEYVGKNLLQLKGYNEHWPAIHKWTYDYFHKVGGKLSVSTKAGNVAMGHKVGYQFSDYLDLLEAYEESPKSGTRPPYLHDVPMFSLLPALVKDIEPFPIDFVPKWYHNGWQNYLQFFMSCKGHMTPLHFDTLFTHNLFFQVKGIKRFRVCSKDDHDKCYLHRWRWSNVDPFSPDFTRFPLFRSVKYEDVIVEPGDILYLPPGTLHHVESLSHSISFNIDWHTKDSVRQGLLSVFKGAPIKNFQYNLAIMLGLQFGIPSRYLFPFYKSYLNYIS